MESLDFLPARIFVVALTVRGYANPTTLMSPLQANYRARHGGAIHGGS